MGSADGNEKIVICWIFCDEFCLILGENAMFWPFVWSDLFLMGESECDAERGTAKISSLSFHKILKIPCALIRYPNECLRAVKAR